MLQISQHGLFRTLRWPTSKASPQVPLSGSFLQWRERHAVILPACRLLKPPLSDTNVAFAILLQSGRVKLLEIVERSEYWILATKRALFEPSDARLAPDHYNRIFRVHPDKVRISAAA